MNKQDIYKALAEISGHHEDYLERYERVAIIRPCEVVELFERLQKPTCTECGGEMWVQHNCKRKGCLAYEPT